METDFNKDSPVENNSSSIEEDIYDDTSSKKDIGNELAKQFGMMTLKNIVQESEGGIISLQDLYNQFVTRAKMKEVDAVGQDITEAVVTLREFPEMFVVVEGDELQEADISVKLTDTTTIPALLSGILKISGIVKKKGTLNLDDLSRYFSECCTLGEKKAIGGNPHLIKETLLTLPSVLHVSGEMVSMVVGNKLNENDVDVKNGAEGKEDQPSATLENYDFKHQQSEKTGDLKEDWNNSKETESDNRDNGIDELSCNSDDKMEDHKHQLPEKTNETDDACPQSIIQVGKAELQSNKSKEEEHSNNSIQEDGDEQFLTKQDVVQGISSAGEQTGKEPQYILEGNLCLNETSNQVTLSLNQDSNLYVPEASASVVEEKKIDISSKNPKQLGIMKCQEIIKERGGKLSVQLLCGTFGSKGTKEERDAIGRKAGEVLQTLQQNDDEFVLEIFPEKGEGIYDQTYVSMLTLEQFDDEFNCDSDGDEQFLTKQDVAQGISSAGEQTGKEPQYILEGNLCLNETSNQVTLSLNQDSNLYVPEASASVVEEKKIDISSKNPKHLGIMKCQEIIKERGGKLSVQLLCGTFGSKGTKEERDAIGRKAGEVLQTLQQYDDEFVLEIFPEKGEGIYDQTYVSMQTLEQFDDEFDCDSDGDEQFLTKQDVAQGISSAGEQTGKEQQYISEGNICLNETSNQVTISLNQDSSLYVPEASASVVEEKNIDISSKNSKHRGIMKCQEIIKDRGGKLSVQLLCCTFGSQGTEEERDAIGRKAGEVLQTLQQFDDEFVLEIFPEKGEGIYDQTYVSIKDGNNKTSLGNLLLNEVSNQGNIPLNEENKETLFVRNNLSMPNTNASVVEEQKVDILSKFAKQLGIMKIQQIVKERGGQLSLQLLASNFGDKGTAEDRDAVGRKACEILQTLQQFDDDFAFETFPEKGGGIYDQTYVSLKGGENKSTLAFAKAVLKIPDILKTKGSPTITQLSTFLNQNCTVDEKCAVGKNPASLKETLLALPGLFHVSSNEKVLLVKAEEKQPSKHVGDEVPIQQDSASNASSQFDDFSNVYQQLGVLTLKEILQEKGPTTLSVLCSYFGNRADDNEREAVGWRAMVVLKTIKECHEVFFINSPKVITVQNVVEKTKVRLVKGGGINDTAVPYAKAIFKLIWFLQEKGQLKVTQLSTCLGQNSTPSEREAVGRSPNLLNQTLKTLPKIFKVAGDCISIKKNAHIYAAKQFILPVVKPTQPEEQLPLRTHLPKTTLSTVVECLQARQGSGDLTVLAASFKSHGSLMDKETYGNNPSALLKILKTLPTKFRCEGSHIYLVNYKIGGEVGSQNNVTPIVNSSRVNIPQIGIVQGALPKSQANLIPSGQFMFDTKNGYGDGWGDVPACHAIPSSFRSYAEAAAVSNQLQPSTANTGERIRQFYMQRDGHILEQRPSKNLYSERVGMVTQAVSVSKTTSNQLEKAKRSAFEILTKYLDQCKIATVTQLSGVTGKQMSAAERQAVGKNSSLLYDTLSSLPEKFAVVGPFVGVKSQRPLLSGVAKLVAALESKGRCKVTSFMAILGDKGTANEQVAIGKDVTTLTQTISSMPGIFVLEDCIWVYLNGSGGTPHTVTKMNKTTAVSRDVCWSLSAGTSAKSTAVSGSSHTSVSLPGQDTKSISSAPTESFSKPEFENATFTLTNVAISDTAMCQEFVRQCLEKYDYPIVSLFVNKKNKQIAIAGWEDHVYLFDMEGATATTCGMGILADVITSDKVLKVVHNCKIVSTALQQCYGLKLANVFDTQVAYHLLNGESTISINSLCKEYGMVTPNEWKSVLSSTRGAAAVGIVDTSANAVSASARVLIPHIYQHMVM